jgi:hypothetical protein
MIDDFKNTIVSDEIYNILQKYNWKRFLKSKEHFVFNRNGEIADYYLNISYKKERLHFDCILDMEFPDKRIYDLYKLINYINDKSDDGYFTLDLEKKIINYKNSIFFPNNLSYQQLYNLIDSSLNIGDELVQSFTLSIHKLIYSETTVEELTGLMFVKVLGHA